MTLELVELRRVSLPLSAPFRTSLGTQHVKDALLIRVETADAEGWGECVADAGPDYSPEYVDAAQHVVEHHLLPRLLGVDITAARVAPALAGIKGHVMAKAAIEMAVLDAELRACGLPFSHALGGIRTAVPAGVSVGIMDTVPQLLDAVDDYVGQGYARIKLKIEPGWDVEPVRSVRERFPDIPLQVDANTAYSLGDARHLAALDAFDLLLIEQPLAPHDLLGHADLARLLRTPICLDESVDSAAVAAAAISLGACQIVNIKAGRVGGYLEARRVAAVCAANGVPVWCGGMVETGLGRAANLALAAGPEFTLPGDVSGSDRFFATDITPPHVLVDGQVAVPTGPGLGRLPDPEALVEMTTSVSRVRS